MEADWRLYGDLRDTAGGTVSVEVDASAPTIADALEALLDAYPALSEQLRPDDGGSPAGSDSGALSGDIAILRNGADLRAGAAGADGLDQALDPDDELVLLPAISGG